ncbi:hypothetical protein [Actinomadura decatromicini]|uniref:Uncharacterized protein n=1 Tax=Actinomadura decatromicini TaxID=2604572 RepID=A0A5D3FWR2_9ACTN|nr:hypothetical protein [Actinomadura decatromicini]TYK52584.1 hypothetical protein FXF68_02090 [Actinomadura decatromicini]
MSDENRGPFEGSRPPVRISGPAHRRVRAPWWTVLRLRRRHLAAWVVVGAALIAVVGQWVASGILDRPARNSGEWAGPPPYSLPSGPTVKGGSPSPTPSPTPSPSKVTAPKPQRRSPAQAEPRSSRRSPAGPPTARITAPSQGARVTGMIGVLMRGTAADLGGRQLRIFDFAPNGAYYLSDEGPIPVSGGQWSFRNGTIGDGTRDVGKSFVLTVVIADQSCQALIGSTPRDAQNNISFRTLPAGCREADGVRITKTAP